MPTTCNGIIKKLDEHIINKIAAGEVIQRPYNALKELIENSIDAKATSISICINDGGFKSITIHDNGDGIHRDDLLVICERFTTSKIIKIDDLSSLQTYGFRGEALASISHVSHLAITSKQTVNPCAYRCEYIDGKPKQPPKPCAGNQGTQIVIENLFYNLPTRRKSLKSHTQEYAKICETVMKYAVHNFTISFCLKKLTSVFSDIKTTGAKSPIEPIKVLYGSSSSQNLLNIDHTDKNVYQYTLKAWLTNPLSNLPASQKNKSFKENDEQISSQTSVVNSAPNTSSKFLLFINHRLVECPQLKKAIETLYQECICDTVGSSSSYNNKNNSISSYLDQSNFTEDSYQNSGKDKNATRSLNYFAYLDLRIDPSNIDVNMHPTKSQVCFLHQDAIISQIRSLCEKAFFPRSSSLQLSSNNSDNNLNSTLNSTNAGSTKLLKSCLDYFKPISSPEHGPDNTPACSKKKGQAEEMECENIPPCQQELPENDLNTSYSKSAQQLLSGHISITEDEDPLLFSPLTSKASYSDTKSNNITPSSKVFGDRTDYKTQKLDLFFDIEHDSSKSGKISSGKKTTDKHDESSSKFSKNRTPKRTTDARELNSIKCLKDDIVKTTDWNLTKIAREHVYVGLASIQYSLFQHGTGLFLANNYILAQNIYYQYLLKDFGRHTPFSHPVLGKRSIYELALAALQDESRSGWSPSHGTKSELAAFVETLFVSKAEMLNDYFSFAISQGMPTQNDLQLPENTQNCSDYYIDTIPKLSCDEFIFSQDPSSQIDPEAETNTTLSLDSLFEREMPFLLLNLATEVDWDNEKNCFSTFAQQLAQFFAIKWNGRYNLNIHNLKETCEKLFYPAIKRHIFIPLNADINKKSEGACLVKIADVKDLYKIFERC